MSDLKEKWARLSPEKRALLALRLSRSKPEAGPEISGSSGLVADAENRYAPFPLTDLQQAYWIGRSGGFQTGDIASHAYLELERTHLDLEAAELALNRVIARHDLLRAVILKDGTQQVLETVSIYRIQAVDLRDRPSTDVNREIESIRSRMSHQVLPSDRWPLFEVRAALLPEGRTRLFLSLDGLILDAWSIAIVLREWSHFCENPRNELPELTISFRDYVLAELKMEKTAAFERAREYWRERVSALPPAPDLPLAGNPGMLKETRFVRRQMRLESGRWERLKALASEHGLTHPGLLLSVYAEVLAYWSKSPDFTLSVPRFNRLPLDPQVSALVGEFASFTLLEVRNGSNDSTFLERSRRIQQQLWRDLDQSAFCGVQVLRELAQTQRGSSGATMPVIFTSLAQDQRDRDGARPAGFGALGEVVYAINQTSQVWLDNHVSEQGGELVCDWDTVDALFPEGLPQDMLDGFFRLLHRLADDPAFWAAKRPDLCQCLRPAYQVKLWEEVNQVTAPIPAGLVQDLFLRAAANFTLRAAVISPGRTLTYGDAYRLSNQWARRLRELGAQPNEPVAIVMEKGWEQVIGVLAILNAGAPYLPIDASLPLERFQLLLAQAGVRIALTQSRVDQRLSWPDGVQRLCLDSHKLGALSDAPLEPVQTAEDLAYVLFTSGSTGVPKGVMIAHAGLVNAVTQTIERFQISSRDRILGITALHHDMSAFDIFGVLGAGGTLIIPEESGRRDPAHWSELMLRESVTLWNSVPAMMEMLLEYGADRPGALPSSLRTVFLGGDWIHLTLPERLRKLAPGAQVVSVGGPTETTLWNIWHSVEEGAAPDWKSIPYGKPIANTQYRILNDALEDCPFWVVGEMCCAGVGVAKGYWRDEEKTRARFIVHPRTGERLYRTGDLGRYRSDGSIEFLGRVDLQVKIQGQRIELGDIESALQQHPQVQAAVVVAKGRDQEKKTLAAYVVPRTSPGVGAEELREFLRRKLPEYMIPSTFAVLERLPLTANGKVDRQALPEPAEVAAANALANPLSEATVDASIRGQVGELVSRVLEVERLDPETNLLAYGANSIDMVRIGNQLETAFGFRPRMDQLFRLQTVAALAGYYEEHLRDKTKPVEAVDGAASNNLEALVGPYRVMLSPEEREAFKQSQPGVRQDGGDRPHVQLQLPQEEEWARQLAARRSHRQFSLKPVGLSQFSRFVSTLAQGRVGDKPKYLYASPGGLYPGQTYWHFKAGRVEGIPGGVYYYHPVEHRLISLTPDVEIDRGVHIPFINTPIFDEAAFSIFFVAQLKAIVPAYGDKSMHFVTLEAGIMAHALEMAAPDCGLGLCQIGSVDFDRIRPWFAIEKSHVLIHSMVGGLPEAASATAKPSLNPGGDKAAQMIERIKQLSKDEVRTLLQANRAAQSRGTER